MKKNLEIGDVVYLTDVAETYKFKVTKVTPTVAYAEEHSSWDDSIVDPETLHEFKREYEVKEALGWKFNEVFGTKNNPKWWLQATVEPKK